MARPLRKGPPISFRLPTHTYDWLAAEAAKRNVSVNEMATRIVIEILETGDPEYAGPLRALDETGPANSAPRSR